MSASTFLLNIKGQESLLEYALKHDNVLLFKKWIANGGELEYIDNQGNNLLLQALLNSAEDIAKVLINLDVDVNFANNNWSALHYACQDDCIEILKLLLNKYAKPNLTIEKYYSALHVAVAKNNLSAVFLLIKNGARINQFDKHEQSPLHLAATFGYTDIASILIDHNAAVNLRNSADVTALHLACMLGHFDVACLLVKHGADKTIKDKKGHQPSFYVFRWLEKTYPEEWEQFINQKDSDNPEFCIAIAKFNKIFPEIKRYSDVSRVIDSLVLSGSIDFTAYNNKAEKVAARTHII